MAQIPRYFSQREATPATTNARVDPSTAAAPYRAAEQSTARLTDVFQSELSAWGKVISQKQAEQQAAAAKNQKIADGLYKAEAMANLSMGSNEIYNQALQTSDGTTNHADLVDQQFQKLVDQAIAGAPSDDARMDLTKRAIGMRAGLYNKTTNASIKANNQVNMDRMEGMLGQYEAYASANPEAVEDIRAQSEDVFKSMADLGLPTAAQEKIKTTFNRNLDYQAVASMAEKDPAAVKDALANGSFTHLGANAVKKLNTVADHSLKAATREAKESLSDVEKSIMMGAPIPQDFSQRAALATKLGLTDELVDVERLVDVSKSLAGKKLPELLATSAELKAMMSAGQLDLPPAKAKKLMTFVDTQVKSLKKDPFQFAANQGAFKPFNTITDFAAITPEEAQQRKYRSLQIEEAYGVKSPAVSGPELEIALAQLNSADPAQKASILRNLNALGEETTARVVSMADKKKDLGLAQAVRMSQIDPEVSLQILQGRDLIKSGSYKADKSEETQAKNKLASFAAGEDVRQSTLASAKALQALEPGTPLEDLIDRASNMINIDRNGLFSGSYKTVAPAPNMSADDFEGLLEAHLKDPAGWKEFGTGIPARTSNGKPLPLNRIDPTDYDYVIRKDGSYSLRYEGEEVFDASGAPVSIDLVKLNKTKG